MRIDLRVFQNALYKMSHSLVTTEAKKSSKASEMSAITHIPALAVCEYMLLFIYPNDTSLIEMRKTLIDFYGYDEIITFDGEK